MAVKSKLETSVGLAELAPAFCAQVELTARSTRPVVNKRRRIAITTSLGRYKRNISGTKNVRCIRKMFFALLPDAAGVCTHHGLSGFASKCLLEGSRILYRAIHAPLSGRVRIGQHALTCFLIGHVLAPDLPIRQEESLLRRKAIDRLHWSVADDVGKRHVCQLQATVVGGILAQGKLAVELYFALVVFYRDEA